MGQSQVAMRRPQWVARDVLHNDRFTAGGGCSAGAGRWSNCHAVDRIGIGPWKARRGATPQAIAVQQRDGRENATGLLLHESAYAIKDFGERIPPGHHLEDPSLHDEDGFSACAFRAQHPFRTTSRCSPCYPAAMRCGRTPAKFRSTHRASNYAFGRSPILQRFAPFGDRRDRSSV
jgi:hypothetical protein